MRRSKWEKTYSHLRKLVHDPSLRVSGPFVRIWYDGNEFIFNGRKNRLIAQINNAQKLVLQQQSVYNEALRHLYDGLEVASDPIHQFNAVRAVARVLLAKEKGQFHAKEITKPQPGARANRPRSIYQALYPEFALNEITVPESYRAVGTDVDQYIWGTEPSDALKSRIGHGQFRAIARAFSRCGASIRRYLNRFAAPEYRYTGGRTERDFPGRVGPAGLDELIARWERL